ncbi:hypothetical protein E2C01_049225 [Portunus trituberculatus]|uniref:Uncharacterized protein n=1 Tax=Portunus trituberculatus TaxID=210409 RepID=A0A5B7GDC7_PORTR|nr:hypothetical protein [Portunus trituberculatus]
MISVHHCYTLPRVQFFIIFPASLFCELSRIYSLFLKSLDRLSTTPVKVDAHH